MYHDYISRTYDSHTTPLAVYSKILEMEDNRKDEYLLTSVKMLF